MEEKHGENLRRGLFLNTVKGGYAMDFWKLGKSIYNMSNPREARRCVIFCVRAILHRAQMMKIHRFFQQSELLRQAAKIYPFVYEQPTRAFFYNRSTFDERAALVESHMAFLAEHLRAEKFLALYGSESILLWSGITCMERPFYGSLFF